jgi:hypothetical protein
MAITAQMHDGTRLEFPDGTDPAVIQATVKKLMAQQAPSEEGPGLWDQMKRQAGLAVRAPIEAAGSVVGMLSDPIKSTVNLGAMAMGSDFRLPSARETIDTQIDKVLPKPETDQERFSNAVAQGGYGAGMGMLAGGVAKNAGPTGQALAKMLMDQPAAQVASGATSAGTAELLTQKGVPGVPAALIGVGAGMLGGKAASAGGRLYDKLASRPQPRDIEVRVTNILENAGMSADDLDGNVRREVGQIVKKAMDSGVPVDDMEFARWTALRKAGVPAKDITRAMVTRDAMDWQTEARIQKTPEGTPLRDAYISAERSMDDTLRGMAPKAVGSGDTGRAVRKGLEGYAGKLNDQATAAYNAVKATPEAARGVDVAKLREALNKGARGSIHGDVYKVALNQLDDLSANGQAIRIDKLEQVQQTLNANWTPDKARAISDVNRTFRDAIEETVGADTYRPAREAFKIAKATTEEQRGLIKLLKKPTDVDYTVADEKVFDSVVMNGPVNELKQVVNTLRLNNSDDAILALKSKTVEQLANALRAGDDQTARFATFDRQIAKISDKLPVLFSPEEVKQIEALRTAAKSVLTDVNRSAVNRSNTANDSLSWIRALMDTPPVRAINTVSFGIPGAVMDAGLGSMASGKNSQMVKALSGYSPTGQASADQPVGRLLAAALLGGVAGSPQEQRRKSPGKTD